MFGREPAVVTKVLEEVVRAAIPMALIFGWIHWSEAQTGAVLLFIGVLVGGISLLTTRSQVVPTEKANAQIAIAIRAPTTTTVSEVIAREEASNQ